MTFLSFSCKILSKQREMQLFLLSSPTFLIFIAIVFYNPITSINGNTLLPAQYISGNIAINCGSVSNSTALDGRRWVGESQLLQAKGKSKISTLAQRFLSADPTPYMTARISSTQFFYIFRVNPGQKFIRLHFCSASYLGFENSQDFFTVEANSFTLVQNFSASLTADALGVKYIVKEFCLNVNESGNLKITFFASQRSSKRRNFHAFVNGIEIISVPTGLYYTPDDDLGALFVGQKNGFYKVDNSTALELVRRLNIGGGSISPMDDVGMFRRWDEDADYLLESAFQETNYLIPPIDYMYSNMQLFNKQMMPHFVAPLKLYQTSRKLRKNLLLEGKDHFTLKVPVDLGFGYLLRLHFCYCDPEGRDSVIDEFDILIENHVVKTQISMLQGVGGKGIAVYRDYLVMMKGDKAKGKRDLQILLESPHDLVVGLIKGLEIFKLSNPDDTLASPNPICLKCAPSNWTSKIQDVLVAFGKLNVIMTTLAIIFTMVNTAVYWLGKMCEYKIWQEEDVQPAPDEPSCRHFSLSEILLATQNFSEALVIGKGGFGKVYKGLIYGRPEILAIKRLKPESKQGAHEFWSEIETLSKLRHIHLVSLIGYCNESDEMILVYEYMPRGTIADNLYRPGGNRKERMPLTWEQRLRICIGAARGLDYLHTGIQYGVIHRDVKDTNILLDENLVAKIADFGLSKLGRIGESQGQLSTKIKGTPGYLDPDYLVTHKPSIKTDVYAFGMVLLVVLSGRPALETKFPGVAESLLVFFRQCMTKGEMKEIIDPCLQGEISTSSLTTFTETVKNCLHHQPEKRPTMAQVVVHLENALKEQQHPVPSILGDKADVCQTSPTGSSKPFEFYELQVAPIREESTIYSTNEGNTSKEIQNADLLTKVEVQQAREKDRPLTQKSPWGRFWASLRITRKPTKKKDLAYETAYAFSMKDIKLATRNFNDKLIIGRGGFGNVYKGFIVGGPGIVAIKRVSSSSAQGAKEFRTEVELLCMVNHINLVSLVGYCIEDNELILVYEYMSHGTLDSHLYRNRRSGKDDVSLTWEQRLKICRGAARGLSYLHEAGVIHRDVNDHRIMLDGNFVAKVSNFGLSKLFNLDQSQSHVTTRVAGTFGYLDPHYALTGELTKASDVYSFGILLLVVLSGRPAVDHTLPEDYQHVRLWYESCSVKGKLEEIVDPYLQGSITSASLSKFLRLVKNCLLQDVKLRPVMTQVEEALKEVLDLTQKSFMHNMDTIESFPETSYPR